MKSVTLILLACALTLRAFADIAAEQEARFRRLQPGIEVSPPLAIEGMAHALGKTNPAGIADLVAAPPELGVEKAMRIVTRRAPPRPSDFYASAKSIAAVQRNDVLLAVFWACAAGASEDAEGAFVFEHASETSARSAHYRFACGREWRKFYVPFLAVRDHGAGEAMIRFHAGYGPQVFAICGLRVISYGRKLAFGELPFTPLAYKGRGADAPWRTAAIAAIEKVRKAQFTIIARSASGKLLPWAEVRVRQRESAFAFGTEVDRDSLLDESDTEYRGTLMECFNRADLVEPDPEVAEWLRDCEVAPRGLNLLWPAGHAPAEIAEAAGKPELLRQRVLALARSRAAAVRGLVAEWEIPALLDHVPPPLLAEVARTVVEVDPHARVVVHAGNVLAGGTEKDATDEAYRAVRALLNARAPLRGIALGASCREQLLSPEGVQAVLDRFDEFRLPLQIADFEIAAWDESAQADYTRDFLTAVYAHPTTTGVSLPGFWAKTHRAPNAALFTDAWSPRPHGAVWCNLVTKRWRTTAYTETNGKGVAKVKGFTGLYSIEVRYGTKSKIVYASLPKTGKWITVQMPATTPAKTP
jgi:endo-1,4-beta-xylanase